MKKEYDFSKAEQGKFYCKPENTKISAYRDSTLSRSRGEKIVKMNLNLAVRALPPGVQTEVYDFVLFLQDKYAVKRPADVREDAAYWSALSEASVRKVWDNEEDDVYNELLKR